jgi:glutathione S-transferase
MLTLYYAAHTCALATHIALEEVGADYSIARIDFATNQQRLPDYLKINPKGRVPALVTDRGILTETPAMLAFVAQSFPKANLALMDDAFAFAQVQAFNSYLCSSLHIAHAHRMRGYRWVDADDKHSIAAMQRKVPESVGGAFELVEHEMLKGPWVMGEWLEADGVDPNKIPRVIDHRRRMSERAGVRKAIAQELA